MVSKIGLTWAALVLMQGGAAAAEPRAGQFAGPECLAPQPALLWVDLGDATAFGRLMRELVRERAPHRWLATGKTPVLQVIADAELLDLLKRSPSTVGVQSLRPPYCDDARMRDAPVLGGHARVLKPMSTPDGVARIRVVVSFQIDPEVLGTPAGARQLSDMQDRLLASLGPYRPSAVTRYRLVPQLALEMDAAGKAVAAKAPDVRAVQDDELSRPLGDGPGIGVPGIE